MVRIIVTKVLVFSSWTLVFVLHIQLWGAPLLSFSTCMCVCVCVCVKLLQSCALLQGIFLTQGSNLCLLSPALAGRFFTTSATSYYRHCGMSAPSISSLRNTFPTLPLHSYRLFLTNSYLTFRTKFLCHHPMALKLYSLGWFQRTPNKPFS